MYALRILILLFIACYLLYVTIASLKTGEMNNAITGKGPISKKKNPIQFWFRIILTLIFALFFIYQIFIIF